MKYNDKQQQRTGKLDVEKHLAEFFNLFLGLVLTIFSCIKEGKSSNTLIILSNDSSIKKSNHHRERIDRIQRT